MSRSLTAVLEQAPLMVGALVALAWARWALLGHRRQDVLAPAMAAGDRPGRRDVAAALRARRAVDRAAAWLPGDPACLPRALAAWRLMRATGLDARLRVGVRSEGGVVQAHAWVEVAGAAVGEEPDVAERFRPFDVGDLPRRFQVTMPRAAARSSRP